MRGFSPALVVMLAGAALILAAGVAWAAQPGGSYSPHIIPVNAKKAPPPPKRERGLLECRHAGQAVSPTAKPVLSAPRCVRVRVVPGASRLTPR